MGTSEGLGEGRAEKGFGSAAWSSSCSRNARPPKGLVRRAQSRIDQAALPLGIASKLGGSINSCAHGTPTMKLWSFDVRSWGPNQATLLKR